MKDIKKEMAGIKTYLGVGLAGAFLGAAITYAPVNFIDRTCGGIRKLESKIYVLERSSVIQNMDGKSVAVKMRDVNYCSVIRQIWEARRQIEERERNTKRGFLLGGAMGGLLIGMIGEYFMGRNERKRKETLAEAYNEKKLLLL